MKLTVSNYARKSEVQGKYCPLGENLELEYDDGECYTRKAYCVPFPRFVSRIVEGDGVKGDILKKIASQDIRDTKRKGIRFSLAF